MFQLLFEKGHLIKLTPTAFSTVTSAARSSTAHYVVIRDAAIAIFDNVRKTKEFKGKSCLPVLRSC